MYEALVGEFVRSWKPPDSESSTFILHRDPVSEP